MKWYQVEEQAAGIKRLYTTYMIYKIFGRNTVKFLIYFITFFAFISAPKIRKCSAKYLKIIGIKPSLFNIYRHFLEYSLSLLDKMEVFSGEFNPERIHFVNDGEKLEFDKDFDNGIFFICSHLGNIGVMRALLRKHPQKEIKVFLSKDQCKIFNGFLKKISINIPITIYPVEDIGIETSIEIKDSLSKGAFIFIAGDRTSSHAANFKTTIFNHTVEFPLGTFKFAQLMDSPIYFICALKDKNDNYNIHLKKFKFSGTKTETIAAIQHQYVEFLEKKTHTAPFQFFHFYDLFE